MATIYIDGVAHEVDGTDNLLHDCLSMGLDVPYFCWHPALGSIGACRACAVKQYSGPDDTRGRIVMSCMTPSADKTYISVTDEEAKAFRKAVVEWLMINHPHDCPVCEEGGHCHLQDMTVMVQHNQRRYRFTKGTHLNQDLGPFIAHEMNRCIACYRCVRYYQDYAGGTDFGVYGAHDNLYFGRPTDGVLESEFSGNLTEVCPTGVFVDRTHSERYNRKWDMQFAPSICQQCAVGCNISPGERYGELRRVENRYHAEINHYFLCDRGRFGYGYVNRKDRPLTSWQLLNGERKVLEPEVAIRTIAESLRSCKGIVGIGSPRASLQSNFALRQLVGEANFCSGVDPAQHDLVAAAVNLLQQVPVRTPTLREMETCDAVLILGEDVTQTAPRVALAVRQALKNKGQQLAAARKIPSWQAAAVADIAQREKSPLFVTSLDTTKLDDVAMAVYRAAVVDQVRLAIAIAHAIDDTAPAILDLTAKQQELVSQIAQVLTTAEHPLLISGTACDSILLMNATAAIAQALHSKGRKPLLSLCVPEVNSMGAVMLEGKQALHIQERLTQGNIDALVVLENDLYHHFNTELADSLLKAAKVLVVIDYQNTRIAQQAHFVLPAGSFAESDGTVINMEGRAQRYFQVYEPSYHDEANDIRESWSWLYAIKDAMAKRDITWVNFDDVTAQCAKAIPALARIEEASPDALHRTKGMKVARSHRRYSGRAAMHAHISVHEPSAPQDDDSALAFSMEGYAGHAEHAPFVPFAWAPGWNSPQAWTKLQEEVGGSLRSGDTGIRLIEPVADAQYNYDNLAIPQAFEPAADVWQMAPLYHLFGSEELSARAEAAATRVEAAYVALNRADAERLHLTASNTVAVKIGNVDCTLPLRISAGLVPGLAGIPIGLAGIPSALGCLFVYFPNT